MKYFNFLKRLYRLDRFFLTKKDVKGAIAAEPEIMKCLLGEPDIQATWEDMGRHVMPTHIIKYDHDDGKPLVKLKMWCGEEIHKGNEVFFLHLQHYALALDQGSNWGMPACRNCVKAAMKLFKDELEHEND